MISVTKRVSMDQAHDFQMSSTGPAHHTEELARACDRIAELEAKLRWSQRTRQLTQRLLASEIAVKGLIKKVLRIKPSPVADFHNPDYRRYTTRRLEHLA